MSDEGMSGFRLHSGDDEWHEEMERERIELEKKHAEAERIYNLPENVKARAFRADLRKVFDKHGLSISHQDMQGAFIITNQRMKRNINALANAEIDIRENPNESDPGFDPNFNPNPAELNHDHAFLYDEDDDTNED